MTDWLTWLRAAPCLPEAELHAQLSGIWSRGVRARQTDAYDREVGVRATRAAQQAFMGELGAGVADYAGVSRGIRAVTRYLDRADEGQFFYAGPTAAVGSSLREVLDLLKQVRPQWMQRPLGVPALADRWMRRSVSLTPKACIAVGRCNEERIAYMLATLSRWRVDSSAWEALRALYSLHDGVFDSAKGSFDYVPEVLLSMLEAAQDTLPVDRLREREAELANRPVGYAKEADAARACAAQFALAVLEACEGEIDPCSTRDHERRASLLKLFRQVVRHQCVKPEASVR